VCVTGLQPLISVCIQIPACLGCMQYTLGSHQLCPSLTSLGWYSAGICMIHVVYPGGEDAAAFLYGTRACHVRKCNAKEAMQCAT
jgi:hypothetical protein